MEQIKVTLVGFNEVLSTKEICNLAIKKAHKNNSVKSWEDFIDNHIYIGNSHLLIVEELLENGFRKEAEKYLKALLELWREDYETKEEMIEETFIPYSFSAEEYDRNISFEEWLKNNKLQEVLKEIK